MFGQTQQFQNQNFNYQKQQVQSQTRQYDEELYRQCGFSFPSNNLFLISLMKVVPKKTNYQKESYIGMITFVLGIGDKNNRTYDFKQKIVQKFSLKDLMSLSFTLKQLALSNTLVLPYTKFTNSGSGAKTLYLQYKDQGSNNQAPNTAATNIVLGGSYGSLKINIILSKSDAYGIADIIERIYEYGIKLEIENQIQTNIQKTNYQSNDTLSFDINSSGGVSDPVNSTPIITGQPQMSNNSVPNETPMANQNVQMSPSATQQINSFGNQYMNIASNASRR